MKKRLAIIISAPMLIAALLSTGLLYFMDLRNGVKTIESEALDHTNATLTHLQNVLNTQLISGNVEDARLSISVTAMHTGVRNLLLSDEQDRIVLANRYILEGEAATILGKYDIALARQARLVAAPVVKFTEQRNVLRAYYPVTLRVAGNELGARKIGTLFFEYDISAKLGAARHEAAVYAGVIGSLLVLSAIMVSLLLRRFVTTRIEQLVQVTQKFSQGKSSARANLTGNDEISFLGHAFDNMAEQREAVERSLRIKDAAIASSINAIAIASLEGKLTYVNQAFSDLWRLQASEDAIGHSPIEFWENPETAQEVMRILQQRGHWQGELHARLGDGGLAEMQLQANMVVDETGQPLCMMASFVDITARKIAEQELQRSEAMLASLIDNMPAMIFVKRASDLRFERLNHAGEILLGFAERDLLGKNDYDFFPHEQAEFFIANDRAVLEAHRLIDIKEEPIKTSSGEIRYLHTRKIGIYDDTGEPSYLLGVSVDITEQKRVEAELMKSKSQYDRLTSNISIGVYLLHTTAANVFSFKYVSERFCSMLNVTAESVYADSSLAFKVIHPDDLDEFIRLNQIATQSREHFLWEGRMLINGVTTWMRIESQPEKQAGGDCIWDGVLEDITERKRAQLELQRNQDLLNEAQRLGKLGSWELDLTSGNLRWSKEIFKIFELDPQKFSPSYENFLNVIHPDDRDKVNQAYSQSLQDRLEYSIVHRLLMADGRIKWVREQCNSDFDESGKPLRSVGAVQDVTEQRMAEDNLRVAAVTFEMHEGIMITDVKGRIVRVNQAFQDITGYSAEDVLGKNPRILSSGRHGKEFYDEFWQHLLTEGRWSGEIWDKRKNGQIYPKWLTITAVKDEVGKVTEYVAIFSDITARKQAEEEIRNLAFYDALTQLPNRRLLMDRFHLALSVSARNNNYGAVMFLDMDRFKTLNDTLGHDYGDLLLIEVSKRIKLCIREMDTVARLGGDEFVVIIEDVESDAEEASQKVALIAEKIRAALSLPYMLKGHECHSSPSIGVSLYRGNAETIDELLKHADLAMYQAKDAGRNAVRFFDPLMQQAVENRASLEADLRGAVSRRQLFLYYQIQVDNDNRPLGAEALIRWIHPQRGMVSPAQFIPVAEESSLILEIGHWVLDTACKQLAVWSKHAQMCHLTISVNVSAQQFMKHDFVESVATVLRVHNIAPERLKLELTESMVLVDVADVVKKMHALKALGVRLSMDDFGTGYSSLSYLKQLPLDQIKIDQSFVRDVTNDPSDAVLVQTIIDMAKNFRLNVIAEGVETEAQLAFLRHHGCLAYQGYLFSKPVPIEQFELLFSGHS